MRRDSGVGANANEIEPELNRPERPPDAATATKPPPGRGPATHLNVYASWVPSWAPASSAHANALASAAATTAGRLPKKSIAEPPAIDAVDGIAMKEPASASNPPSPPLSGYSIVRQSCPPVAGSRTSWYASCVSAREMNGATHET